MGLFSKKKDTEAPTTIEGSNELKPVSGFGEDEKNMFSLLVTIWGNQLDGMGTDIGKQTKELLHAAWDHFKNNTLSEFDCSLVRYYFTRVDPNIFEKSLAKSYNSLMKKLNKLKF